jgi:MYXO-CTERM domain-containing protein
VSCWYVADGTRFDCSGYDCYAAADEVVSYCEDAYGGCSTSSERVSSGSAAFGLLGLLGLATTVRVGRWLRARKKKSN